MKNALILFAFNLPFLILQQFSGFQQSEFLGSLILVLPLFVFHRILKKSHSEYPKDEIFRKVYRTSISTGAFFGLWMGAFHYFNTQFFNPQLITEIINLVKINLSSQTLPQSQKDDLLGSMQSVLSSPVFWIFYALLIYSFIFSILGIILGFIFKSKASI